MVAAQVAAYNKNPEGQEEAYSQFQKELQQYEDTLALVADLKLDIQDYEY